uniref:Uncharacterized protein n=1 Tax=Guillardia theta TaxID=55529 RepID=A0A7S4NQJ6_GUITH|mmetsp:Transcript_29652/g.94902  ORF Transcript_29652/g.94902 Transcript_29652/m.94902 type:complete len:353 (+) Transcript_29652:44-1102(+)
MANSPSRTPLIVLPVLTVIVLCLALVAIASRQDATALFSSNVDEEVSRLANIPWLSKEGREDERARKIAQEKREAQERRKQMLKVSEKMERLQLLRAEKAVGMKLKAQRDSYITKAKVRQTMADNIQEHSSKLKHAAHLIEHKEQRLSQSKYQPLQLNLDKMQQMLLTAKELLSDDKASLHAREKKVLEQRHAAQKAAQEGDLGSLRKAEALLPDLKDIAAGERAQVKADRRRMEQISAEVSKISKSIKEVRGQMDREKKDEETLMDVSSRENAIAQLISDKAQYFDDLAAVDAAKLRYNKVLELLHERHSDHKQAKQSLAAISNNIQDWKRKEARDVASLKSAARALRAQH